DCQSSFRSKSANVIRPIRLAKSFQCLAHQRFSFREMARVAKYIRQLGRVAESVWMLPAMKTTGAIIRLAKQSLGLVVATEFLQNLPKVCGCFQQLRRLWSQDDACAIERFPEQ